MEDRYNLQRFLSAQEDSIERAIQELKHGQKLGHWMWYVFPQIKGLGSSSMSQYYAIQNAAEATAYLQHSKLASRLIVCTDAVNEHQNLTAEQIFGYPDYLKFRSSMTLFAIIAGRNDSSFSNALNKFFAGEPDIHTVSILTQ